MLSTKLFILRVFKIKYPVLSSSDTEKESERMKIKTQIEACRSRLESVRNLFDDEKFDDSRLLLERFLDNCRELIKLLSADEKTLGKTLQSPQTLKENLETQTTDALYQTIEMSGKVFKKIERLSKVHVKSKLKNPMDRFRSQLLLVKFILIILLAVIMSAVFYSGYKFLADAGNRRDIKRVQDLTEINNALQSYKNKTGEYPKSEGWNGTKTCWGKASSDWVPGLIPQYLPSLPVDPSHKKNCDKQYVYNSDGTDYKLISHNPETCEAIKTKYPNLIDPKRDCWAFGYWSAGAKDW